jgi:hypothetical protein
MIIPIKDEKRKRHMHLLYFDNCFNSKGPEGHRWGIKAFVAMHKQKDEGWLLTGNTGPSLNNATRQMIETSCDRCIS